MSKEELEIYSFLVKSDPDRNHLVLQTKTFLPGVNGIDEVNIRMQAHGWSIPQDARQDYKLKNLADCSIPSLGLKQLRYLHAGGADKLVANGSTEFHRHYGRDAWLIIFSRVGFSQDGKTALVYEVAGPAGTLFVLKKVNGRWAVWLDLQIGAAAGRGSLKGQRGLFSFADVLESQASGPATVGGGAR